jgi:hypothetical protein
VLVLAQIANCTTIYQAVHVLYAIQFRTTSINVLALLYLPNVRMAISSLLKRTQIYLPYVFLRRLTILVILLHHKTPLPIVPNVRHVLVPWDILLLLSVLDVQLIVLHVLILLLYLCAPRVWMVHILPLVEQVAPCAQQ